MESWRILLVEDDPGDAALVDAYLRQQPELDTTLVLAPRMNEALRLLQDADFDVCLVDLGLPDGQGVDAIANLTRAARGRPIVILSGTSDSGLAMRCLEAGAQDYLGKEGLSADVLRRTIGHAIARSRSEELQQRLQEADRQGAIGQLAAGVAHEIRAPATSVLHTLQSLLATAQTSGTPAQLAQLAESIREVERVVEVARELRGFAATDDEVAWIDLAALIAEVCRTVRARIEERGELRLQLGELPRIAGLTRRLRDLLRHLLDNAAQAIETSSSARPRVTVSARRTDGQVLVAVEDEGCGIPPEHLPRIFDPYFTTRESDRSTGLGLALCDEIARKHRGKLTVSSTVGAGSRFVLDLPVDTGLASFIASSDPTPPPEVAPREPTRQRVLVIDDEPLLIKSFARMLRTHHEVETALGGVEGLELLDRDDAFDVVFCDLMMPRVDGVELHEVVRARHPRLETRLVFLTGGVFTERVEDFLAEHEPRLIEKPVSLKTLLAAVTAVAASNRDPSR